MKKTENPEVVREIILRHSMTHEMVPTRWLKAPEVWQALLRHMPMLALVRNLGRLTALGVLKDFDMYANKASERLEDAEAIRESKIHPLQVLLALRAYDQGRGERGKLKWDSR